MKRALLIAGGGTGGHIFPALAISHELKALDPDLNLAMVATGKAMERQAARDVGIALEILVAKAFRGQAITGRLKALALLPGSIRRGSELIDKYNPAAVLAVGGYAALPLGLAAVRRRVPLLVQEQNAVPGLTNRILGRFCRQAFLAFDQAKAFFPPNRCLLTGNPIRPDLLDQARQAALTRPEVRQKLNLLVLGGSQGAGSLNKAMAEALPLLAPFKERLHVFHQTGAKDRAKTAKAYAQNGFSAEVRGFFADIGRLYGQAHLVLCRAGAGTLSELTAVGRAAVCVPYPFAAGDHQTHNALALTAAGAARLLKDQDLNGRAVADFLSEFMVDPSALEEMEIKSAGLSRPRAASEIARICLEYVEAS